MFRKISAAAAFAVFFVGSALVCSEFFSCRSPILTQGSSLSEASALRLVFLVQGGAAPGRLLLSTASKLTVTLNSPSSSSVVLAPQTVAIPSASGTSAIPVSFPVVPFGTYTVSAAAYAADNTTVLFSQSASLAFSQATETVTLNLLPEAPPTATIGDASTGTVSGSIGAAAAQSWSVAGAGTSGSPFSVYLTADPSALVFVQSSDGTLLNPGNTSARCLSLTLASSSNPVVTIYNPGAASSYSITLWPGSAASQMVPIAGGSFNNGVADVTVGDFSLSKYEVTQALYAAVVGSNPSATTAGGMNSPVDSVSWYDAAEFCNKLSLLEGLDPVYAISSRVPASGNPITSASVVFDWDKNGYRLPTEAEWQWAASGGALSAGHSFSGSDTIDDVSWYATNSGSASHPVGLKAANELGLHDMSGNASEWCQDWYGTYPGYGRLSPEGPASGSVRTLRGGSWAGTMADSTPVQRASLDPSWSSSTDQGFRVARGVYSGATVTTLAGLAGSHGSADGTGAGALFYFPEGLACGGGNVYVADNYNNAVRSIVAATGATTTLAAPSPGYTNPQGVATDASGNIWVAEEVLNTCNRVVKIDPIGTIATAVSISPSLSKPAQLVVAPSGVIYTANSCSYDIASITGNTTAIYSGGVCGHVDGPSGSAKFHVCMGIARDSAGNIYVADTGNNAIRRIDGTTKVVTTIAGAPDGSTASGFLDGIGTAARFSTVRNLAFDPAEKYLYVTDASNNALRRVELATGKVQTVAGGSGSGSADGRGALASFYGPFGLACDASGVLYVSDLYNHTVRKVVIK